MAKANTKSAAARFAARRRNVFRSTKRKRKVDALLLTDPHDIRYLTGVTEGAGSLLMIGGDATLVTTPMFRDCLTRQCPGSEVVVKKRTEADDLALGRLVRDRKLGRIGFQKDLVSLARYQSMCKRIGKQKLAPLERVVDQQRAAKDDDEIKTTRKAVRIAEKAFRELTAQGAKYFVGRTELQLAAELEFRMRNGGAERQGFPATGIIVAAGPNSASCHHNPTNRKVRRGDVVLFDWGAELDGYRSDITRVVFIGDVPPKLREVYEVVRQAHAAAIAVLRPGMRTKTIDKAARDVIEAAGYGDQFPHGLGHGIGLQIHEYPFLTRDDTRVKKDMIVTIEPGIYFDGIGGIRLEDDILITADGYRVITSLPTRIENAILR